MSAHDKMRSLHISFDNDAHKLLVNAAQLLATYLRGLEDCPVADQVPVKNLNSDICVAVPPLSVSVGLKR